MSYVVVRLRDSGDLLAHGAAGPDKPRFLVLSIGGAWRQKPELGQQFAEVEDARIALDYVDYAEQEMEGEPSPRLEVRIFEHRVGGWWIGPRVWPDPEPVELLGSLA